MEDRIARHIAHGAAPAHARRHAWARRRIAAAHERQLKAENRLHTIKAVMVATLGS